MFMISWAKIMYFSKTTKEMLHIINFMLHFFLLEMGVFSLFSPFLQNETLQKEVVTYRKGLLKKKA